MHTAVSQPLLTFGSMQRERQVANDFIADEDLARGAAELARTVNSVDAPYVAVKPVLAGLAAHGSMLLDVLAEHTDMAGVQLDKALPRLQDLGLISVSLLDGGGQMVSLTEGGTLAANQM